MKRFDTLIRNGKVILPGYTVDKLDIGVQDGRITELGETLDPAQAEHVIEAAGLAVLPGSVDCHFHLGIYRPLDEDTMSETKSALVGGVTSILNYFRTGQHYMNKSGSYREIMPEVLAQTAGRSYVDYGFHLAPMESRHLQEMEWLAQEAGVTTFKYFMFYKGLNLSASSTDAAALTMSDSYDLGHLYLIMEEVARLNQIIPGAPLSVSVHCEDDELIKRFIAKVNATGIDGLEAYNLARPPLSERVAILKAGTIAAATGAPLNVLHITSADAFQATRDLLQIYPQIKLRREVTLHALGLTYDMLAGQGLGGKVNPPIRTAADGEALWQALLNGEVDWVGSDHACTPQALKGDRLWPAACGFGGTALMYPYLISEGYHKRGLSLARIAELASTNPAKAHALYPHKGSISLGMDADLALIDLELEQTVSTEMLLSAQEYTPFAGLSLKGWPVMTILRGQIAYDHGTVSAKPQGRFLHRPL